MIRRDFERTTAKACASLKGMSKDQTVEYVFTISKAANWYYFAKKFANGRRKKK